MTWYKRASRIVLAKDGPHSFSSTQVQIPEDVAKKILAFSSGIPDEDLGEDGRENDIHITVKYGIHTEDIEEIRSIISGFGKITATLGKTTLFPPSDKHEVLKIDVESDDLHELNKMVTGGTECTTTYPDYHPHVTIAYLGPGKGEKYVGDEFEGIKLTFDSVTFSNKDGTKTTIPL